MEYSERPRTERKVNRIKDLYFYIKKHGPIRRKELLEVFEVNVRMLERDLNILVHNELIENPKIGVWQVTTKKVKEVS